MKFRFLLQRYREEREFKTGNLNVFIVCHSEERSDEKSL